MIRRLLCHLGNRRLRRLAWRGSLAAVGLAALATSGCVLAASRAQRDFRPVNQPIPPARQVLLDQMPKYRRPEGATYLTFPEWYLVFNPQEYAQYLATRPPSGFPYFTSIGQFWNSYAQVSGIANREYPFNFRAHLMVTVIGTSSTVEYVVKGVYENSVGRLSEWSAAGARTPEDDFAALVARAYGDFIPTRPWFEFPYGRKFAELWSAVPLFGPHFPRKLERKCFLSLEYGVKFLYAGVIRLASHAVYGTADTEIYATVGHLPAPDFENPGFKRVQQVGPDSWIVTLPHYQGFTDVVPRIAGKGVDFEDIAGNDEILLTIITPAGWQYDLAAGRPLFRQTLLSGTDVQRVAIQAPVQSLGAMLREIQARGFRIEHLFDY